MWSARRWSAAHAEYVAAVDEFLAVVRRVPGTRWHEPLGPGRWSPAATTLHVTLAYEFGREAAAGGPGMQLRVAPVLAWLSGHLLLPLILATGRFPRGADAPAEVVPDLAEARTLTPAAAVDRLRRAADEAASALARVRGPGAPRVVHAYFGRLSARQALRVLSAHTRHHARALGTAFATSPAG